MHILHVVGARPNFMKVAPVMDALANRGGVRQTLVHTGQHYDANMSEVFFEQLGIPVPDVNLDVGSGSHAVQTAQIMIRSEEVLLRQKPDLVLVYGDVNSTVASALVCAKLQIPVGHVEAGLRSFDRTMPEEINRLLTDQVVDLLFTPSEDGDANLIREGVSADKIFLVGNVMIDTLARLIGKARDRWPVVADELGLPLGATTSQDYVLVTLHRPSNVDDQASLKRIILALEGISERAQVVFPLHPRTRERIGEMGAASGRDALCLLDPISYLDFVALQSRATAVITDSGGVQEETTYLGVPCLTVRENTERPITVSLGTNTLVGQDMELLTSEVNRALDGEGKRGGIPPLWDGLSAGRIADVIIGGAAPSRGTAASPPVGTQ